MYNMYKILVIDNKVINLGTLKSLLNESCFCLEYDMYDDTFKLSISFYSKVYSFDKVYCLVSTYGYMSAINIMKEEVLALRK